MSVSGSKVLRSALCLMLAVLLTMGTCISAFATEGDDTIKYVSLGDSMTNGYGLDGYDDPYKVNGFLDEVSGSYPAQFANWLVANGYADEVEHFPLAISAMRAEDLHFILEYPNGFAGDYYTYDEFIDGRFNDYAELHTPQPDYAGVNNVAGIFQSEVAEADIISMGIGNANFGVFLLGRITNALNVLGGNPAEDAWIEFENALELCDESAKAVVMQAYDAALELLKAKVPESVYPLAEQLANVIGYTVASYILNVNGSLDAIAELNDGADIIIVGIMNTMSGLEVTYDIEGQSGAIDMGTIMAPVIESVNFYLAALPTAKQAFGHYEDHNILYAEASNVEMLVSTYNAEISGDNVIRDRFIEEIAEDTVFPMIKDMINGLVGNYGLALDTTITRDDVEQYEALVAAGTLLDDTSMDSNKVLSCALYLAFEEAVLEAAEMTTLDGSAFLKLVNGLDDVFSGLATSLNPTAIVDINAISAKVMAEVQTRDDIMGPLTSSLASNPKIADSATEHGTNIQAAIAALDTDPNAVAVLAGYGLTPESLTAPDADENIQRAAINAAIADNPDVVFAAVLANEDAKAIVAKHVARHAGPNLTTVLSDALTADDTVMGLLNLFARMLIGNGIGCHPSPAGHGTLTAAVTNVYANNITAEDAVVEKVEVGLNALYGILEAYGPEVAAQVWAQWEEYGYVEQVNNSIEGLKATLSDRYTYYTETALPAIEAAVGSLAEQKESLCTELDALNTELAAKKAELAEVLAQQEIGDIYIPDINIDVELGGNEQTEVPEHECVVAGDDVAAELEAAIADLEHAIAVIEALIADITADMEDLLALAEQIAAAVEELEQTIASIVEAADDLAAAIEAAVAVLEDNEGVINAVINSFDAARATVLAAVEVVELTLGTAETMIADIDAMISQISTDAEALYNKFITDLPACIAALPEEAQMLIGGAVLLAQQGLEEGKALINAKLQEELSALAAEYDEEAIRAEIDALATQYGIDKESIDAELAAIQGQIEAEVNAQYAAIEAETNAQIEALKAEAQAQIDALNAELAGYEAELEAAAEEAKAEIQAQIDRVTGDIAVINEDLACAIGHLEEAAGIAYDEIVAEVTAAYETAMAELNTKLAELETAYNEAVGALEESQANLQAAYEAAVAEATANADQAIADLTAAVEAQIAELGIIGENLAAAVDSIFAGMHEDLAGAQTAVEQILMGNLEAVEDLGEALADLGTEAVADVVESIRDQLEIMFTEATTDDYAITEASYYVALGDGSAVSQSYVDELAAHLGVDYANLAQDGLAVEDAGAVIAANGDKIAAADLITLGFSNATFVSDAIDAGLSGSELDWSTYVTEDGVVYVEDALAEISAHLAENGITGEYNAMAVDAVEAYAYSSVAYACALPELVNAIRAINTDATIIIVGQYNPFEGSVVDLDGVQMDLGEYVDYLVDGAAVHGIAYCMLTGNAIYVEAPDADTDTPAILSLRGLLQLIQDDSVLFPNETGHEYIKNQILKALNYYVVEPEEPAGLWGDADSDGDVDNIDSMLVLQYYTGAIDESELNLNVCDVDGNGSINNIDSMQILQRYTGAITKFPVE